MHLKTLTLRGFKSFASTTTLNLEPGITCVVGPNGSGKSNVVDALAWVMGEQGAKTLRGAQMADVIFAGTTGRAPLGRAQVALTIDNTDGALPIEYSEVTISRTLFRGGGSEYSINGTPCRLLDIQELLSDTGMGRQMHVIVGQGQLDAVLASGPMERRGFIEEAAGVLKHRRRKERALRKLDSMEGNLVRVRDLVSEIQRQLKPLAKQAETARRASVIQATVRDARARLLADELEDLQQRLGAGAASHAQLQARRNDLSARLDEAKAALEEAEETARKGTPRTQELTRLWQEFSTVQASLSTLQSLAQDRLQALEKPRPKPADDLNQLSQRVDEANAADSELLREVEEAGKQLAEVVGRREEAETAARRRLEKVRTLEAEHAARREQIARLVGDVQAARDRLSAAQAEVGRMDEAVQQAKERAEEAQRELQQLGQRPADDDSTATAHTQANAERDRAREAVDALIRKETQAHSELATWRSRLETLGQSLAPEDTTAQLLESGDPQVKGALAPMLRITDGYENAVAALLEPLTDSAVVTSMEVAAQHADGNARRMVIASQTQEDVKTPVSDLALPPSVVSAGETVQADPQVAATVAALLANCAIAPDIDSAQQALKVPGIKRVATTGGDVLSVHSVQTSGSDRASVLRRHAEYERAAAETARAEEDLEQVRSQLKQARTNYDKAVQAANEALKQMRQADSARAKEIERHARASSAARAAAGEYERLQTTRDRVAAGVERARQTLVEAEAKEAATHALAPLPDPEQARAEADSAEDAARAARAEETNQRLQLRTLEERSTRAKDRARSLRQQLSRSQEANRTWQQEEQRRQRRQQATAAVLQKVRPALAVATQSVEEAARALAAAESERTEASEVASARRRDVDDLRAQLLEISDAAHRDEIALQEVKLRFDHAAAEAVEQLGMETEDLISQFGPHNLVEDDEPYPYVRAEQEKRLRKAQRELDRLGAINPLALEEHEALSTRHKFLTDQLRDLTQSKADLLDIVEEVDARVEEVFTQAFFDTQAAFAEVFATLFPGGSGKLSLTDPEDMLNTGVEIEVRPAGKKINRLSLLSGGERSLAAVALLVAIFKARPSPFYVMDEVEAALDDVNLSRLLEIFTQLRRDSQLIIVTHQKRTMRIADALYGVTMRDGVTSVVSSRLAETDEDVAGS
ncbi:MAG: chromosome segregation protein SMC [Actinomycetaceae bacterium]|nr:chromosome segregation protein SMC [Actinomycetaceae bacterium]